MKIILFAVIIIASSVSASAQIFPSGGGKIDAKYDRFTDKTTVALYELQVLQRDFDLDHLRLYLSAGFNFEYSKKPEFVALVFSSWSLWNDRYREPAALNVILDAKRKQFGEFLPTKREVINGKYVVTLIARVTTSDFLQLANAKKVEMRLGDVEFSLSERSLTALHDFARRIEP